MMPIFRSKRNYEGLNVCVSQVSFEQEICMWFGPINEVTYVYVVCRSTFTIVVKEPVISSEPTIETGTTRDRPVKRILPSSDIFP